MKPFQQRVVTEKAELDSKLIALKKFLDTPLFEKLDENEKSRLMEQSAVMGEYSEILGARIAAFREV